MTRPRAVLRAAAAPALVALAVAACLPASPTAEGRDIGRTYVIFLVAAAVVAAVVLGSTTFAIVRYRRSRVPDLPRQTRGNFRAEAIWTILPALTVVGLFTAGVLTLLRVDTTEATPGVEVDVSAFRWGWEFRYPESGVVVSGIGAPGPEIVVPVREVVRFRLTSADVVHSFFVPAFLEKRDANPGRENVMQVTLEDEGTYRGQCAEFCGLYHWKMPFAIRAVARADFDAWLASQPRGSASPAAASAPAASGSGAAPPGSAAAPGGSGGSGKPGSSLP